MKISDLITKLEESKATLGDVEVEVRNGAGDFDEILCLDLHPYSWRGGRILVIDADDGDPTP